MLQGIWATSPSAVLFFANAGGGAGTHVKSNVMKAATLTGLCEAMPFEYRYNVRGNAGPKALSCYLPHEVLEMTARQEAIADMTLSVEELAGTTGLGALTQAWAAHDDVQCPCPDRIIPIRGACGRGAIHQLKPRRRAQVHHRVLLQLHRWSIAFTAKAKAVHGDRKGAHVHMRVWRLRYHPGTFGCDRFGILFVAASSNVVAHIWNDVSAMNMFVVDSSDA